MANQCLPPPARLHGDSTYQYTMLYLVLAVLFLARLKESAAISTSVGYFGCDDRSGSFDNEETRTAAALVYEVRLTGVVFFSVVGGVQCKTDTPSENGSRAFFTSAQK
ncbi:hypothetical protein BaRGS_00011797 [Batillaria attramentaria]|uniref:Uncharacterized protein n=1 Tax=Batillaria attramentaria TaxID=370345 RepID=A0ABD0LCJ0_9CAEN